MRYSANVLLKKLNLRLKPEIAFFLSTDINLFFDLRCQYFSQPFNLAVGTVPPFLLLFPSGLRD